MSREAKVTQFDDPLLGEQEILWLDVPVNDLVFVTVADRLHHLVYDLLGLFLGEPEKQNTLRNLEDNSLISGIIKSCWEA